MKKRSGNLPSRIAVSSGSLCLPFRFKQQSNTGKLFAWHESQGECDIFKYGKISENNIFGKIKIEAFAEFFQKST